MYGRNMLQSPGGLGGFGGGGGGVGSLMDQAPPADNPGGYQEQAPLYYTEGGKVIKQRNFTDPATGETFPIYEEYRTLPPGINAPDGTMVDPDNIYGSIVAQQAAPPQNLAPRPPNAAVQDTGVPMYPPPVPMPQIESKAMPGGSADFSPGGIAQQRAPVPGGPTAQIAGSGNGDWSRYGNELLYNTDNAKMAVANVLKDMGINPNNGGNLIAQMIQRAAPGLGLAFQEQQAQVPNGGRNTGPGEPTDFGAMFQGFLKNAIGGGNVGATLQNASAALPAIIQSLRNLGQSGDATAVNPFAQALMDTLDANSGQGTIAALSSLNGPLMSASGMQGYSKGLQAALASAIRGGVEDNTFQQGSQDIWHYLLGI